MKLLVEGFDYDCKELEELLPGYKLRQQGDNKGRVGEVGYYFNKEIDDCLFCLPKVLLSDDGIDDEDGNEYDEDGNLISNRDKQKQNANLILGRYNPQDIIDLDKPSNNVVISEADRTFLYNFAIWIYRSLVVYRANNKKITSIDVKNISQLDNYGDEYSGSNLDTVLALIKFHNENKDFLLFTLQNIKKGYNKISWNKTISHQTGILQKNGSVIYMNPVNKKKRINYEEELFVIFYSILNYVEKKMGFTVSINMNFELIPENMFENYLAGFGRSRLLQIKYKYFSDKALKLWNLCYHFFDSTWKMHSVKNYEEYLLSKSYDRIFENIIDDMIGQKGIPNVLKNQKDDKIVDHIYSYESLLRGDQIYYIGDSKYYKIGHEVKGSALYKQYTYAKNVIQYNIEWFMTNRQQRYRRHYRDELTEGYNITPNFFISAKVDSSNLSYEDSRLAYHPKDNGRYPHMQRQFRNRLFDRDTMWLSQYDVNFLYVIALYVRDNRYIKDIFRDEARNMFRRELIPIIEKIFDFYILELKEDCNKSLREVVDMNFRLLSGKIYCPFTDNKNILILALENDSIYNVENRNVIELLDQYFNIYEDFKLNISIDDFLKARTS